MLFSDKIKARALRHMRDAQDYGWHKKHLICDYAQLALEAEGFDEPDAARAVDYIWGTHFEIMPPL